MEVIYQYVKRVVLKNDDGELFLNEAVAFEENIDEILVRTQVVNTDLKRGWIGDLTYETSVGKDVKDERIDCGVARDTFHDVLLANVRIWMCDTDGVITWEYRFLKK
jgi:hypothetical protein